MASLQLMLNLEKQHLDSNVRSSEAQLGSLLCDEYREFGTSGKIRGREETLTSVTSATETTEYKVANYEIDQLGEDHVLATYQLSERKGNLERVTLRSSVWRLVDRDWRLLFHQGTQQAE